MSLDIHLTKELYDNDDWDQEDLFCANVTHNLGEMADEAGIYMALWRPEEIGCVKADDIITMLEEGIEKLVDNPTDYEKFNPENGWGTYEGLVKFAAKTLEACKKYPDACLYSCR